MISLAFLCRKSYSETTVHNPKASKEICQGPHYTCMQTLLSAESMMEMNTDKRKDI